MSDVHDPEARARLLRGAEELGEELRPTWGEFTCGAMLFHLNAQMRAALGELAVEPVGNPAFWHTTGKAIALSDEPWPPGVPTSKEALPAGPVEFDVELERFRELLERLAATDPAGAWPDNARFGPMTGREWSRLTYNHVRHHFRQFGVWAEGDDVGSAGG